MGDGLGVIVVAVGLGADQVAPEVKGQGGDIELFDGSFVGAAIGA
jgi:hypothetical protein